MSNQFLKLRRSAVPGKIPDTGSLDLGEIALNTYDGLAFMKRSGSSGEEVIVIGNSTGSYTGSFTGEFTGSLLGTASWAYNAVTASTADNFYVRGNITGSNALITGTITAQTLVVQTITSSVIYSSGSNIFGNKLTDTQQFTGSVSITGSLTSANVNLTGSYTGSFFGNGSGLTNISASSVVGLNLSLIGSGSVTASTDPAYGFKVNSNTQISGSTQITGSLGVTGSVSISGSLGSIFSANIDTMVFSGSLYQTGSIEVTGSVNITGSLKAVIADISGSFSGSFFGNGGGLTNISASSIVGLNLSQIASGSATASISPDNGLRINVDTTVTGSIRSTSNIYANKFVFQDGVIDANSTGQNMFGTDNNTFYLFSGNNGLLIRNQGDNDTLVTLTNDGSLTVPYGITGSLYGTASWALNALTASYAIEGTFPFTGSAKITGSLEVVGPITNTGILTTNTFANPQIITSDISIPAAHNAMLLGPVGIQETLQIGSGSNLIVLEELTNLATTSSNTFNGNQTINGILSISGSQILSSRNNNVNTGNTVILQINKLTYIASFFDYVVNKGSDFRSGTVSCVWNPTTNVINYNDVTASYIGNTSGLTFSIDIVSDNLRLIATAPSNGWTVNTMAKVL